MTLTGADEEGGSRKYRLDDAEAWTVYIGPVAIGEGTHALA